MRLQGNKTAFHSVCLVEEVSPKRVPKLFTAADVSSTHQQLLLLVGGGVTGHSVQVHQVAQHAVTQHGQVCGDGGQGVAHEDTRGVAGQVELAQQELHGRLAEVRPALQQFDQGGEGCLGREEKPVIDGGGSGTRTTWFPAATYFQSCLSASAAVLAAKHQEGLDPQDRVLLQLCNV